MEGGGREGGGEMLRGKGTGRREGRVGEVREGGGRGGGGGGGGGGRERERERERERGLDGWWDGGSGRPANLLLSFKMTPLKEVSFLADDELSIQLALNIHKPTFTHVHVLVCIGLLDPILGPAT